MKKKRRKNLAQTQRAKRMKNAKKETMEETKNRKIVFIPKIIGEIFGAPQMVAGITAPERIRNNGVFILTRSNGTTVTWMESSE